MLKIVDIKGRGALRREVAELYSDIFKEKPWKENFRPEEVMMLMEELNARGATIIFATHDERLFENSHRRVLRFLNGKIRT